MITWEHLKEKFFDKGYFWEFNTLIGAPPIPDYLRLIVRKGENQKDILERFHKTWAEISQKEWEYWNTWIDYQKHK